jgi:hypothetical protein
MSVREIFSPKQAWEDKVGHRGKKLVPGLYWTGFRDAGYQRNVVRGVIVMGVVAAIRVFA